MRYRGIIQCQTPASFLKHFFLCSDRGGDVGLISDCEVVSIRGPRRLGVDKRLIVRLFVSTFLSVFAFLVIIVWRGVTRQSCRE